MNTLTPTRRLGIAVVSLSILLAACASGSAPSAAPPSAVPPSAAPSDAPVSTAPGGGSDPAPDPGIGAKPILPRPGQLDVHPVVADSLSARVDGNKIIVKAVWTSGVEPCNILDSIVVDKGDGTYTITLREGHGPEDIACIAIAEQHVTEFEIPDVAAGTWTIVDSGGVATPVEVTVG